MTGFSTIEEGIEEIRQGRLLLVVDDEDRENEGDLVMAADRVTPEAVNFMAKYGRGLICVPLLGERLDELKISMMVSDNTAPLSTAFTITVDARRGVTTGTSAYDRAVTIRTLVDPSTQPEDLTRPGHILPLRAMPGGVLRRAGHTEAAVDLARMADCSPAGVICEVLDDNGAMARVPQLVELAARHGLKMATIKDSQPVHEVIIQEGVYTFESVDGAVAEPVVYMVDQFVVGGFYRVHTERGRDENLNAPGMHFVPLAFPTSCNLPDCRASAAGSAPNRLYAYGVVARLALLAASIELESTAARVDTTAAPVAAAIAG